VSLIPPGQSNAEADLVQSVGGDDHEARRQTSSAPEGGDAKPRQHRAEAYDDGELSQKGAGGPPADVGTIVVGPFDPLSCLSRSKTNGVDVVCKREVTPVSGSGDVSVTIKTY
jgi:hypothetical protein